MSCLAGSPSNKKSGRELDVAHKPQYGLPSSAERYGGVAWSAYFVRISFSEAVTRSL
jgi:hypothetical protein